ncbi:hypothetical protein M2138_001852 [Dysgonomonadaceae bacterium PH5-43]|nr:hypothetical protein [Dysgonomonadaceae bacterium PH5-43]
MSKRLTLRLTLTFAFLLVFLSSITFVDANNTKTNTPEEKKLASKSTEIKELYDVLKLKNEIPFKAFEQAYAGYKKMKPKKTVLTLIDYSRASTEKRMYVLDLKAKKVLFKTLVAHGRNSGENYATSFSNEKGSHKSSLGFFLTEETYMGGKGYSLRLCGLEKGINHNARERAVVIHAANYATASFAANNGRLGRSYGCPALPPNINKPIIDTIKNGSLIYIYAEKSNKDYISKSKILK